MSVQSLRDAAESTDPDLTLVPPKTLLALCDLADHARAFTDATAEADIKLAQELELKMLDDLARIDGEDIT